MYVFPELINMIVTSMIIIFFKSKIELEQRDGYIRQLEDSKELSTPNLNINLNK